MPFHDRGKVFDLHQAEVPVVQCAGMVDRYLDGVDVVSQLTYAASAAGFFRLILSLKKLILGWAIDGKIYTLGIVIEKTLISFTDP